MITTTGKTPDELPDGDWIVCVIDPVPQPRGARFLKTFTLDIASPKMKFVTNIQKSTFKVVLSTTDKYPTNIVELTVDGTKHLIVGLDFRLDLSGDKNKNKLLMQKHILDVVSTEIEPKNIFLCGITDGAKFEGIVPSGMGPTYEIYGPEVIENYRAGFFIVKQGTPYTYTCTNINRPGDLFIFAESDKCGTITSGTNMVSMLIDMSKSNNFKFPRNVSPFIEQLYKYVDANGVIDAEKSDLLETWNDAVLKSGIKDSSTVSLSKPEDQVSAKTKKTVVEPSEKQQTVDELNRYYAALHSIGDKNREIYKNIRDKTALKSLGDLPETRLSELKKLYQDIAAKVTDTYKSIDRTLIPHRSIVLGGTRRTHVLRRHKTRKGKRFTKKIR